MVAVCFFVIGIFLWEDNKAILGSLAFVLPMKVKEKFEPKVFDLRESTNDPDALWNTVASAPVTLVLKLLWSAALYQANALSDVEKPDTFQMVG